MSNLNMTSDQANHLMGHMTAAFPEALVSGFENLTHTMPNNSKDRHVAAAAVAAGASLIVTFNLKDFMALPDGIVAISPDNLLASFVESAPRQIYEILLRQASDMRRPPVTVLQILAVFEKICPQFRAALAKAGL